MSGATQGAFCERPGSPTQTRGDILQKALYQGELVG